MPALMVYDFVVRHLSPDAFGHKHKMEREKKRKKMKKKEETAQWHTDATRALICILQLLPC